MPQIKQYEQQVNPSGPADVQRATPQDFGYGIGQAIGQLGNSAVEAGAVINKRQAQEDLSNLDANIAKAHDNLESQYKDQFQKGTLDHDDFMENVNNTMDSIQQNVNTRAGSLRFQQLKAQTSLYFSQQSRTGQASIAGERAVQDFKVSLDSRSSALENNPQGFELALQQQNQSIADRVATGGLPANKGEELKTLGMTELAKSALYGVMKMDPDQARHQLDSGQWDSYMNGDVKRRMYNEVDTTQRAKLIDQERQKKLLKEAQDEQIEKVSQGFISKLYNNGLPTQDVLDAMQKGKIDSSTAEHFLKAIEANNQERKVKSDPYVFNDLTQRLALPDGDPRKITDIAEINKHLGYDLSIPDGNLLYGLLQDKHTPQGDAEAAVQKTYFEAIKTKLVKKDAIGMEDPEGMKLYQDVQSQSYEYALSAAKKGKSKFQIWSPTINGKPNEDYVGNHVAVPFRSAQDIMKSTADIMKRSMGGPPSGTTEMELPDGKHVFIPNKNVDEAIKRKAKRVVK